MTFVTAVAKSTGLKQEIPEEWLDHPVLSTDFELPPSARAAAADTPAVLPSDQDIPLPVDEHSTPDELLQYAAENDIDLGDAADEAQALALIRKHHESPSAGEEE